MARQDASPIYTRPDTTLLVSFQPIPSLLAGIEGVESVVQEFFSENELSVVRNDIPGVKVVLFYFF